MKIALIVTTKFTDYTLLEKKLNELNVTEVVSGTSNGYEMLKKYEITNPNVNISLAKGGRNGMVRANNAMKNSENVVVFANGDGIRTERSIVNAIKDNKNLTIFSYKTKALNITTDNQYINIKLEGNLKEASQHEGLFLNKEEAQNLISKLQNSLKDLT